MRRLTIVSLIVLFAMVLAACGGAKTPAPAPTEAPAAAPTEAPAAPTVAPEAKAAVGVILPTKDEPRWLQDQAVFQKAGWDPLFSQGDSAKEKANVEALISQGVKVIIITPQDATAAAAAAQEARDAGVKVISYDRLIRDTDAVDYYVTFDSMAVGAAWSQYLIEQAGDTKGNPLYIYTGAATDNNAFIFFEGAWEKIQPKIADGTFVIKNSSEAVALQDKPTLTRDEEAKIIGQTTTNWNFNDAKNLAEANLTAATAADKGTVYILAPNDGTARAIADAFAADKEVTKYYVTGQDAEKASVQYVIDGKQSMTVLKDVRTLAADAVAAAQAYLSGGTPEQTNTYNNGKIDVPAKPSAIVTVTKDNVKEALIDSGYYQASDFTNLEAAAAPAPSATGMTGVGASAEGAASKGLTCLADAYNGKMKGTKVSLTGPFADADVVRFDQDKKAFEEATGITIEYVGSKEFEAQIGTQMAAGTAPDIIDWPQPGLAAGFFEQGKVIPVTDFVPEEWLKENYKQSWLDMATMTGPDGQPGMSGLWWRFNGKSLVWYPKAKFEEAGYTIPTTWEELLALQDEIVADGDTPWCIGIGSGAATGWPATDWTEDLMLRTTSPENYDKWVKGELKFDSPEVRKAIETFAPIWNDDAMVYGGKAAIVSTLFNDAPAPMFQDPPKCWLHRQGNFITSFFPETAKPGVDYDVFYFPPVDPQYGKPFLVAGDLVSVTQDRPEVCAVIQWMSTAASVEGWLAAGGAFGPQNDVTLDMYGIPLERSIAELAAQATTLRFDASDLMPGAVGAGSFWKGFTDYFSGAVDLDTMLKQIDGSWPKQ